VKRGGRIRLAPGGVAAPEYVTWVPVVSGGGGGGRGNLPAPPSVTNNINGGGGGNSSPLRDLASIAPLMKQAAKKLTSPAKAGQEVKIKPTEEMPPMQQTGDDVAPLPADQQYADGFGSPRDIGDLPQSFWDSPVAEDAAVVAAVDASAAADMGDVSGWGGDFSGFDASGFARGGRPHFDLGGDVSDYTMLDSGAVPNVADDLGSYLNLDEGVAGGGIRSGFGPPAAPKQEYTKSGGGDGGGDEMDDAMKAIQMAATVASMY
jgi:hypothetical protein